MRSLIGVATTLATSLFVLNGAAAGTLSYDLQSVLTFGDKLTVSAGGQSVSGLTPGQIELFSSGPGGLNQILAAWCLDPFTTLAQSGTYTTTPITTSAPLQVQNAAKIMALVSHGSQLVSSSGATVFNNNVLGRQIAEAIQIAIWTVEYSDFSYVVHDNNNQVVALNSGVANMVSTYLANVTPDSFGQAVWSAQGSFEKLSATPTLSNQTLIAIEPVPEPSTWAMAIVGFAALGFAARVRAKRASAA